MEDDNMLSNKEIRGNVFEITQQLDGIDYREHVRVVRTP
jgi:ATP-dependent 26S proteasome regulatory subunit